MPAAPVGENIGGPFLQRGCRAARAGHRAAARSAAPAGLGQRRLAGRLRRLRGADELSEVDLQVDVDDGHVAATFGAVEAALAAASPIVARLVMPMPTWHGHAQRFYRLRDTAEFTAVDVVVFQRSDPRRYHNQTGRHGRPLGPVRPGRGRPARAPRPGRTGRHPGQGGRWHPGAAAIHPACPWWPRRSAGATPGPPSGSGTATCWPPWSPSTGSATPGPPRLRHPLHPPRPARPGPGDAGRAGVRDRPGRHRGQAAGS